MPRCGFLIVLLFSILSTSPTAAYSNAVIAANSSAFGTIYCNHTFTETKDLDCTSPSSNDFYGVGVRLGVYFTWTASWIANLCNPNEIAGALDANAIFLISLMVSMFYTTTHNRLAYIDGLMLMQICAGYMFGCFSIWGYRTVHYFQEGREGIRHYGRFGTHSRLLLAFAISVYGIWFWSFGVSGGLIPVRNPDGGPKPCQCYPLYTFFFDKVLVYGWVRYLYIIMSSGTALYFGLMILIAVAERLHFTFQLHRWQHLLTNTRYATGLTDREVRFIFRFLIIGNAIWIVFSILSIELTLYWNNLSRFLARNIATPSQLLPLLVGLLSLIRVVALSLHERFVDRYHEALGERNQRQVGSKLPASGVKKYVLAWAPWLSQIPVWSGQLAPTENATAQFTPEDHGKVESGHQVEDLHASTPDSPQSPDLNDKELR